MRPKPFDSANSAMSALMARHFSTVKISSCSSSGSSSSSCFSACSCSSSGSSFSPLIISGFTGGAVHSQISASGCTSASLSRNAAKKGRR